jgi:predicted secreted protein
MRRKPDVMVSHQYHLGQVQTAIGRLGRRLQPSRTPWRDRAELVERSRSSAENQPLSAQLS